MDKIDENVEFANLPDIKFLNDDVKAFYESIKKQLRLLFIVNVFFCSLAVVIALVGIILCIFFSYIQYGVILALSGVSSELLGNLFINQYRYTLNKVCNEYYKLLLCNNMNEALNLAKKLPLRDSNGKELRYLEVREILRALMDHFNDHLDGCGTKCEKNNKNG